jgi:pimeloyl-ACP methyl ester carboxylesterase
MSDDDLALTWKRTRLDGRTVSYGEAGSGPPLLFLHGWGLGSRSYRRAIERLVGSGLRVVAPSLPGFGGSADLPRDEFSIHGYGRWVWRFADEVGIDGPVILLGHSFGGGVAIRAAAERPSQIRLLTLVNSVGGSVWKATPTRRGGTLADRPLWDWGVHFPRELNRRTALPVLRVIADDVVRNVARNPLAFWRVAELARRADLRLELEDLRDRGVPIVVLWGTEDRILPQASCDAIAAITGTTPEFVAGNHSWLIIDPDHFAEVMTNVLAVAAAVEPEVAQAVEAADAAEAIAAAGTAFGEGDDPDDLGAGAQRDDELDGDR